MRYLTIVLAAACVVALAPTDAWAQGTLGIKGGLNVSTLSVDDPANPDFGFDDQTDFVVGAFLQYATAGWFALQAEILYSQNGAKAQGEGPDIKLNLNYLRVPVLLMARLASRESPMYPILYAGPQVAFETRCQVTGEQDGASVGFGCEDPELGDPLETKKVEFGLVFGGGFEILFSRLTAQLDARYNLGLTNLNASANSSEVSVKNRGWSFILGVGIPLE
jgi:hypothetical protein